MVHLRVYKDKSIAGPLQITYIQHIIYIDTEALGIHWATTRFTKKHQVQGLCSGDSGARKDGVLEETGREDKRQNASFKGDFDYPDNLCYM